MSEIFGPECRKLQDEAVVVERTFCATSLPGSTAFRYGMALEMMDFCSLRPNCAVRGYATVARLEASHASKGTRDNDPRDCHH